MAETHIVLDMADDKNILEKRPFVFENLDPMLKQAAEWVLNGPFIYVSDD